MPGWEPPCPGIWWILNNLKNKINQGLREGLGVKRAVNHAVEHCIDRGVLDDILTESRMEVIGMLLYEYDERKVMKYLRKESREEGMEQGIKALIEYGQELGASREKTLGQLVLKCSLTPQKAEEYMEKYWK